MAPSFESAASSLLCPEDNNSIMGFDDDVGVVDGIEDTDSRNNRKKSVFGDFFLGLPLRSDECLRLMVEREGEHLPREDYLGRLRRGQLDISLRRDAVNWIGKVHAHYGFGPLSAYLSINYLDRFLSAYELPQGKSWMMQLLSVACLSLAAKMEETVVPLVLDLQVESKYVFEARTIQRMELLVLSTLQWRMQAITPFSFLDCFLRKLNDGNPPPKGSIARSVELVLNTIRGIEFMGFRPSEIAAAVAVSVSTETETVDFDKAVSSFIHVQKERVQRCHELLQDSGLVSSRPGKVVSGSVASVPQSPVGVLDAACLSYKSDEITVGSCANSHITPLPKRRKLNRYSEMEMKS